MREDKYTCDRCGGSVYGGSQDTTICVVTGRSQDPSGNGYEDDVERVDLCLKCCAGLLYSLSRGIKSGEEIHDKILKYARKK